MNSPSDLLSELPKHVLKQTIWYCVRLGKSSIRKLWRFVDVLIEGLHLEVVRGVRIKFVEDETHLRKRIQLDGLLAITVFWFYFDSEI